MWKWCQFSTKIAMSKTLINWLKTMKLYRHYVKLDPLIAITVADDHSSTANHWSPFNDSMEPLNSQVSCQCMDGEHAQVLEQNMWNSGEHTRGGWHLFINSAVAVFSVLHIQGQVHAYTLQAHDLVWCLLEVTWYDLFNMPIILTQCVTSFRVVM